MRRWLLFAVVLALAAMLVVGCTQSSDTTDEETTTEDKGTVIVGSKIDTEGGILGQIIIQMLEADGFTVEDQTSTGATDVVRKALETDQIDVYPEYTANGLTVFYPDAGWDPEILKDARATYEEAAALDLENADIVWLEPAPANNTWAVAIPQTLADENSLTTLDDWATYINDGGDTKIVGSQEFFDREDAMPSFETAYGFELTDEQKVALATGDTAVTEQAAADGTDGANAAMAYGTDGTIAALGLFVLEDPKGAQPIYQPAPIFRGEIIETYPEIPDLLDPVFALLDKETLQDLNSQVALEGKDAATVAADFLAAEGFTE